MTTDLDERDQTIPLKRADAFGAPPDPRAGDFIAFPRNTLRRAACIWPHGRVQTTEDGSFYLGESGHLSCSGGMLIPVGSEALHRTDRHLMGDVWLFHHDIRQAGNAVTATVVCRVDSCPLPAPAC